jgi:ferric-dicitrate binding protein FerR (iron transport regulator)
LKQDDFDKIDRYIKEEADKSEREYVESLFLDGENNLYFRNCMNKDWDLFLRAAAPTNVNLNHLLDRIHHIVRKNETIKSQGPLRKLIRYYMKAAAVLFLPLIIAGGILSGVLRDRAGTVTDQRVTSTIYAPMGSRVAFILPDSTTGMLNSGSYLTYSLPFNKKRELKLEGEAWFKVKRDEENPFEVSAGNSMVKVLGTSFNLSAYPAENYVEVVLQEGKVEFQDTKESAGVLLSPSERLVCQNDKINKYVVDPAKYSAWTKGRLVFRGDPMDEVARRIERWYNVKVIIANKELLKYSFRATFEDDTLEEVLRCLALTSPISYKISPGILLSDGTHKKEEVTIYKRRI